MDRFTRADLQTLIAPPEGLCVSVFTSTHRGGAELQDLVRWKEQLNEAEQQLVASDMRPGQALNMTAPARLFLKNDEFWRNSSDGLALFLGTDFLRIFRLPLRFANQVFVGPRFHVKPLLPWISGDGRFYVLAVSQNQVRLLEGTAHSLRHLEPPKLPANFEEALRTHDKDETLTFHTHPASIGRAFQAVFSGHGVGIDDHKDDLLRYFQKIDRSLHATFGTGHVPLVLATVDYLVPIYRKANKYPHLIEPSVKGNPDHLSDQELHDGAWPLVAPTFRKRTDSALAQFRQLAGTGRTTQELSELIPAAYRGELETLFVAARTDVWGRFNPTTEQVEAHHVQEPGDEDLANLAVTYALSHGRNVHVVEPHEALGGVPLAGVYFLPMAKHAK
jgi:release factor family 7